VDILLCAVAIKRRWAIFTTDPDFSSDAKVLPPPDSYSPSAIIRTMPGHSWGTIRGDNLVANRRQNKDLQRPAVQLTAGGAKLLNALFGVAYAGASQFSIPQLGYRRTVAEK
jgi:hypothetical protein